MLRFFDSTGLLWQEGGLTGIPTALLVSTSTQVVDCELGNRRLLVKFDIVLQLMCLKRQCSIRLKHLMRALHITRHCTRSTCRRVGRRPV